MQNRREKKMQKETGVGRGLQALRFKRLIPYSIRPGRHVPQSNAVS